MNTAVAFLESRPGLLESHGIRPSGPLSSLILTPRFQASRHVVFLLMPEGRPQPVLIAKVARLDDRQGGLAREAANLRGVQALRAGGFSSVPRLVAFEVFGGRPILVETALAGPLLSPSMVRRDRERAYALVVDWLATLHVESTGTPAVDWFDELVNRPFAGFANSFPLSRDEERLVQATRDIVSPLGEAALPFVWEHGDLSHPNLLLTGEHSLGVIDWELARPSGQLGYDLFVFLAYVAFSLARTTRPADQVQSVRAAMSGPHAWAVPAVLGYAARCRVPASLLTPLFVLTWARYTMTLVSRLTGDGRRLQSGDVVAWVRANRYYQLWSDAVANAAAFDWSH